MRGAFTTQVGQKQRGLGLAAGGQGTHGGRQLGLVTPASQAGDPAKGTGRAEHDGHVVPALRQRMGKGVHGALGGGGKGIGHPKHHTRGPQRYKALPGGARAHAHGAGGVVARACRHDHAFAQPPAAGYVAQQRAGGGVALGQGGHVRGIQPAGLQHGRAPGAGLHIQPQGAGCIGHITHRRAGELQPQPVFGQQHGADLGEDCGLMRAQPQQLGGGEAGHGEVAGDLARSGHGLLEQRTFRTGAAVIPQDGGAQHLALRTQHHRAVHVARQADAAHLGPGGGHLCAQLGHSGFDGGQPVCRVLLAPGGVRAVLGHGGIGRGDDGVHFVQQQ